LRRLVGDGPDASELLFDATIGGMGLTGVIVRACFKTIRASSSYVRVDTRRADDLDALMSLMVDGDAVHRYSVAWVDGMARGRRLGRGVLTCGDHVEVEPAHRHSSPPTTSSRLTVPSTRVSPLNRVTLAAFNEMYFRKAPRNRMGQVIGLAPFFYPLDSVGGWNRLYGSGGFLQYQVAVPDSAAHVIRECLERLARIGAPSFLSVLKRFGPGRTQSPLSFPIEGWTLAIDVPTRTSGLADVLDDLDEKVLGVGGRHYLAKDSRAVPATIAAGYPRLADFREVKRDVDPDGVFVSDLSRRLNL
jgi:decaprenylphospho-beta-D-ribofuranose 2-oxidase